MLSVVLVVLGSLLSCVRAGGQVLDVDEMLAREVTRLALIDLRLQISAGPDDFSILDSLLADAERLTPDNPELLRRRVEAAYRIGEPAALLSATRQVIRVDPSDTVAVLRLISLTISSIQTAADRLTAYDRFLGPGGRGLDASVRSRLSLDAALLARETGDEGAFVRYLTRATQLDPTNKDAAALAATYFCEQVPDDPVGRFEMIANVLRADPIDPNVHFLLSQELAEAGAFAQARRFHRNARTVMAIEGREPTEAMEAERLVLDWRVLGAQVPMKEISTKLESSRHDAKSRIEAYQEEGLPIDSLSKPEDIHLNENVERVRVLAADAAGDSEVVNAGLQDLAVSALSARRLLSDPDRLPEGITPDMVRLRILSIVREQFILHAWVDVGVEALLPAARSSPFMAGEFEDPLFKSFVALHSEPPEVSERVFSVLAERDPVGWIGVGLSRERAGRTADAIEAYRTANRLMRLRPAGAWARDRAIALGDVTGNADPHTEVLNSLAAQIPTWFDAACGDGRRLVDLSVSAERTQVSPLEPMRLTIRLRNVSPMPLSVGNGRSVVSRVVVSPILGTERQDASSMAFPEIIDLGHRLRLLPQESVTVTIEPDAGLTGLVIRAASSSATRVRHRLMQGIRRVNGRLFPGPLGLSTESDLVVVNTCPEARLPVADLANRIRSATDEELPRLLGAAQIVLLSGQLSDEEVAPLGLACAERYGTMDARHRALALALLPHARLAPSMANFDRYVVQAAADESDPLVLKLLLLTRAPAATDALFESAAIQRDPKVAQFATRLRARMNSGHGGFAAAGPRLRGLAGLPTQESGQ